MIFAYIKTMNCGNEDSDTAITVPKSVISE